MNLVLIFFENYLLLNLLNIFIDIKTNYLKTYNIILIILFIEGIILPSIIKNTIIALFIPFITILTFFFLIIKNNYCRIIIYELVIFVNYSFIKSITLILGILLFKTDLIVLLDNPLVLKTLSIISVALFFLEYLYIKAYLKRQTLHLPPKTKFVILIVLLTTIVINTFTIHNYIYHQITATFYFSIITASIIINYLIWYICVQISSYYHKSLQQDLYLKSIEYGRGLVATINKSTDEYNRLQHDLKHHLVVIKNMIKHNDQNINKYVNNLKMDSFELINSGNLIINYIINEKIKVAKINNIDFKTFITGIPTSYIDDADMCVVLANMLDNAINGANRCHNNKFITVKIDFGDNKTIINISNSYHLNYFNHKKGKPKNGHGYGLSNIKNTVYKYNGIDLIEVNKGILKHCCVLFK